MLIFTIPISIINTLKGLYDLLNFNKESDKLFILKNLLSIILLPLDYTINLIKNIT